MKNKKIAIFQAHHVLQVHTLNIIHALLRDGYSVDLYIYKCKEHYLKLESLPNLTIFNFSDLAQLWNEKQSKLLKILEFLRFYFSGPLSFNNEKLFHKSVMFSSKKVFSAREYYCSIAVEKMGLIWANILQKDKKNAIIYYSLELYSLKYAFELNGNILNIIKALRFIRIKILEAYYHKKCKATIIQDMLRAKEIARYNSLSSKMEYLYLPVSLDSDPYKNKSNFLREKFNIPNEKKVLLQFGNIGNGRMVKEVAQASQDLENDWIIVMHGKVHDTRIIVQIKTIDKKNKIIISDEIIHESEINKMIASADIGLCFYPSKHANDYLTGFSSEKLARYFLCGLPVITMNYPSFMKSVYETGSGVCVNNINQLNSATQQINSNYDCFSLNSYKTYEKYFTFSIHFAKVLKYLNEEIND